MPVFNNARTIRRALDSLLAQSETNTEIIISDDGSTDSTREVVADYARSEPRIRVFAQPRNLNYGNFRFVLQQARAPYFMFAAGDDWWEQDFIASCIDALRARPSAVAAIRKVLMHPDSGAPYLGEDTAAITGDVATRLFTYLCGPGYNSRMYSVFRTEVARHAFPRRNHHAYDWTFSAATLMSGEHLELPTVGMHREATPPKRYIDYVRRDNVRTLDRLFPLAPMTRSLLWEFRLPLERRVLVALFMLNLIHHREYVRAFHPRLARLYTVLGRGVSA